MPARPEDRMHEVTPHPRHSRLVSGAAYPWLVVGLLWFCGFFNYADRQAVYSVFPLLKSEFHLNNEQLGLLGSAFMFVYAVTSPFSGYTVDRLSRRLLIALGLAFWSLICAATRRLENFVQLVLFRGAEGLGEAFYFPASMSVLADYHGPADPLPRHEHPPDQRLPRDGRRCGPGGLSRASITAGGHHSGHSAWPGWLMRSSWGLSASNRLATRPRASRRPEAATGDEFDEWASGPPTPAR